MAEKHQRLGSSRLSLSPKKIKSSHKWEIEEEDAMSYKRDTPGHGHKQRSLIIGKVQLTSLQAKVQDCTKRTSERYDKLSVIVASCRCIVPSVMHVVDLITTVYIYIYKQTR